MKLSRSSALLKRLQLGRRAVIALPLVWLTLFFLLPFALVLKISRGTACWAIRLRRGGAFYLLFYPPSESRRFPAAQP